MLNVIKEKKGSVLLLRLAGSIDETSNLEQLVGLPPTEMTVNCKEVPRINSEGIKSWMKYFQLCRAKGTKLKFVECSTAIVDQLNFISNFSCGGTVESVFVPFSCMNCKSELVGLFKSEDLRRVQLVLPDLKCSKCGDRATFDDIPEDYFGFLLR